MKRAWPWLVAIAVLLAVDYIIGMPVVMARVQSSTLLEQIVVGAALAVIVARFVNSHL